MLIISALSGGMAGCNDNTEFEVPFDFSTTGKPASISVSVSVPNMEVQSRADLSDANANRVTSLWVRVYNANTGAATSEQYVLDNLNNNTAHTLFNLPDIATRSGSSFIVAVANIDLQGRKYNADGTYTTGTMRDLLATANTWTDFCAISALTHTLNNSPSVTVPLDLLPMCGIYYAGDVAHVASLDWSELNNTPFFIPVTENRTYTLPGTIHLRRLSSYVKFNLIPGNGVTLTPQSYRVRNVPRDSWLFDRAGGTTSSYVPDDFNMANSTQMLVKEQSQLNTGFFQPAIFTRASFYDGPTAYTGSYSFDFWQMENKHTGTSTTYNEREKEVKVDSNGAVLPDSDGEGTNSGIYTSLCSGSTWEYNNTATMVEIRCNVSPANLQTNDANASNNFGTAIITVHLGYVNNDATDFNCLRNSKYTYNVTINGLDDIRVEALQNSLGDETIPGLEGSVTQITEGNKYELDAHYGVFNISLSDAERMSGDFGYIIEAWEAGEQYSYDENDVVSDDMRQYIDWVEFIPTTSATVLADYNPDNVIKLDQMGEKLANGNLRYPHSTGTGTNENDQTQRYYTVHVNEYVYQTSTDETDDRWRGYVNQPERGCWIKTVQQSSPDGQSIYITSKYAFTQKSIQTYYDLSDTDMDGGAVGLEHVDESEGLNLRSMYPGTEVNGGDKMQEDNGRYNVNSYLTANAGGRSTWSRVVNTAAMQTIPAITAQGANYPAHTASTNMLFVPALVNTIGSTQLSTSQYDPQPNLTVSNNINQYMEAMNACTNRNRDNNGDGTIDADEVRWYVPSTGKCLRMILGRNSLSTPIMDYNSVTSKLYYPTAGNQTSHDGKENDTRFKMFSSTREVIWCYEGMSISQLSQSWSVGFWEVRCVRNLGTNLANVYVNGNVNSDGTEEAYTVDANNRTITMSHYDAESIRPDVSGSLPIHFINSTRIVDGALVSGDWNMCAHSFEYADSTQDIRYSRRSGKDTYSYAATNAQVETWISSNPCSTLNDANYNGHNDWRVPNQKEMSIIRNAVNGQLPGSGMYYMTCTQEYFDINGYIPDATHLDTERRFISVEKSQTCAYNPNREFSMYIKCVRDID